MIFSSDAREAMETAKLIIGGKMNVDLSELTKIALDKAMNKWQRIAAIYSIGFIGDSRASPHLQKILSDVDNDENVRSHAAEALGNIGDYDATGLLKDIMAQASSDELRESCKYALEEIVL